MGTTCSGRYLNTRGAGNRVSDFAVVHSNEGAFVRSQVKKNGKVAIKLRLSNGGHGQKGMDLLTRYHIPFTVTKTYSNGVRIGNVPEHMNKRKRTGNRQSWFPENWSERDIRRAGEHVAGLKSNRRVPNGKIIYGTYKGVRVGVIRTNGQIATVFPDVNQTTVLKRRRKK